MKWFDKWFSNKVRRAWEDARSSAGVNLAPEPDTMNIIGSKQPSRHKRSFEQRPMTFQVYQAHGGYAVEYTFYDEIRDKHDQQLHIVPADANLAEAIGKIIQYQMMIK